MIGAGRRAWLVALAAATALPGAAQAGTQAEEPLANAVRTALSAAIASAAPPKPEFADQAARLEFLRWLGAMSERLKRFKSEAHTRVEFLETLWYESRRAGLEHRRGAGRHAAGPRPAR